MIPVFEPEITKSDRGALIKALDDGEISGTFGKSIPQLEKNFAKYIGVKYSVAVTNGSSALHLSISALNFPKKSEILVSSTTNIASAVAITHNNCIPIPIDSDLNSWNIDTSLIEKKITKNTKAIVVVHFLGNPSDMKKINSIANKHNLKIIEDAAEAHGAKIGEKKIGSYGFCGCFSFYANKIITSGEGGIITTNNREFYEKLKLYRNLGFTKPRFVHFVRGYNFRMTGYQAALANNQLKRIEKTISKKIKIQKRYENNLRGIKGINFQISKKNYKNVFWMVGILINRNFKLSKNKLKKYLKKKGIESRDFFKSIGTQPCFKKIINKKHKTPNSNYLWKNGLYLPSSHNITNKKIDFICKIIKNCDK
tara:strand:+ start:987 stop:2090 length:1104 start_codon:yes stop_codon:yes gene_type:complete